MENHPIPQDVTGFKFKLIGSVTVKQFLYILAGGILAVVCFILPISAFIKVPLAALFGGMGVMLAFIPIEGRPMDVMAKNFLKALPAENQYIYRKKGAEVLIGEFFGPQLSQAAKVEEKKPQAQSSLDAKRALLYGALKKSYKPDEREAQMLSNINSYLNDSSQHSASPPVVNADAQPAGTSPVQVVTPTSMPEINASEAIRVVTPPTPVKEQPVAKPAPSTQEVDSKPVFEDNKTPILSFKEDGKTVVPHVDQAPQSIPQMEEIKVAPKTSEMPSVMPNESQNVTTISQDATLKAGFPQLPDTPNVVLGIVKDPRGKILPNILVEIMNTQGIPVRAFKTNALGQFAAATPLPDGEYNVLLEDPRRQHEFEQIHIKLEGKIFEPLEIISVDQREKLRRELFESQTGVSA
jgi:hypothetical protein